MAMSETRAKELAQIEPPSSMKRIVEFLDSLSLAGVEGSLPTLGLQFSRFSAGIAEKTLSSMFALDHDPTHRLLAKFNVTRYELRDFALWLVKWDAKRGEVEVLTEEQAIQLGSLPPRAVAAGELLLGRRAEDAILSRSGQPEHSDRFDDGRADLHDRATRSGTIGDIAEGKADRPVRSETRLTGTKPVYSHPPIEEELEQTSYRSATPSDGFAEQLTRSNRGLWAANLGLAGLPIGVMMGHADMPMAYGAAPGMAGVPQPGMLPSYGYPGTAYPAANYPFSAYPAPDVSASVQSMQPYGSPSPGYPDLPSQPIVNAFNGGYAGAPQPVFFVPGQASPIPDASQPGGYAPPGYAPPGYAAPGGFSPPGTPPQQWFPTAYPVPPADQSSSQDAPDDGSQPGKPGGYSGRPGEMALGAAALAVAAPFLLHALEGSGGSSEGKPGGYSQYTLGGPLYGHRAAGHALLPSVELPLGGQQSQPGFEQELPTSGGVTPTALHGQLTLIAPPMNVASPEAEASGTAVSFPWKTLAQGAGPLDAGGLQRLQAALPPGAKAIYPALPEGALGPNAVNMTVEPHLLGSILDKGYGSQMALMAPAFAAAAASQAPGTPSAQPLAGSIIPTNRPMKADSVLPTANGGATGALGDAGGGQAKSGGPLDFLGMPIRLAPSLGGRSELQNEVAVRSAIDSPQTNTVRPNEFSALRQKLFPGFQSVVAEPDEVAWRKAAPSFGLRDNSPTTLLSPDSRITPPTPSGSKPQAHTSGLPPALDLMSPAHSGPSVGRSAGLGMHTSGFHEPMSRLLGQTTGSPTHAEAMGLPGPFGRGHQATGHSPAFAGSSPFGSIPSLPGTGSTPIGIASHAAAGPALTGLPFTGDRGPTGLGFPQIGSAHATAGHGTLPAPGGLDDFASSSEPGVHSGRFQIPSGHQLPAVQHPAARSIGMPLGMQSHMPESAMRFPTIGAPETAAPGHAPALNLHASVPPAGPARPLVQIQAPRPIQITTSMASAAPARLFSPAAAPRNSGAATVAIQKALGPQGPASSVLKEIQSERQKSGGQRTEGSGGETDVLAHEVWALLKRRLATEADRQGRW